jgi:hypothetical protein
VGIAFLTLAIRYPLRKDLLGLGIGALLTLQNLTPLYFTAAKAQTSSSMQAFANLYSLQALIDFDSLGGAQYDPSTGTLALYGRRAGPERFMRILYLDHLAAAFESDSPKLSLLWTEQSRQEIEQARNSQSGFFNVTDASGRHVNRLGSWLFRQRGVSVVSGADIDSLGEKVVAAGGLAKIFGDKTPIPVPQDIARLAFSASPKARADVKGMPARSSLAAVALAADIQTKTIPAMPELRSKIAGYQTFADWERSRGSVDGEQITWISLGRFEIEESLDGRAIRFKATPMRINMARLVAGKPLADPILTGYAEYLTRHYDDLAAEFPALHELRECAKIMAVKAWFIRHGWRLDLPKLGRLEVAPPAEVPGIVVMTVTVDVTSSTGLKVKGVLWPSGGIDLGIGDTYVVRVPLQPFPTANLAEGVNAEVKRVLPHEIFVPLPPIPGWVARATQGQAALNYVALQASELGKHTDAAAAQEQLEIVQRKAKLLAHIDGLINVQSKNSVAFQAEASRIEAEAREQRKEYLLASFDAATSIGLAGEELVLRTGTLWPRKAAIEALERAQKLDEWKTLLEDIQTAREDFENRREGKSRDPQYWQSLTERGTDLAIELQKQLKKEDPRNWVYAGEMAARRNFIAQTGYGLYGLALKWRDLYSLAADAKLFNANTGAYAASMRSLQPFREKVMKDFLAERRKYEEIAKNPR